MSFFINPKRLIFRTWQQRVKYYFQLPFVRFGLWLGFWNLDYNWVNGYPNRIKIGKGCSIMNAKFSTHSGFVTIGDNTIFGYDCMILTGQHRFYKGKRAKLVPNSEFYKEVPDEGHDITIGSGCYISSGSIILGGVTIGDNVIIGAGSVVTKDIPSGCFACGVPAQVKSYHKDKADPVPNAALDLS
ncbi:MAG: hypothetical protein A2Z88_07740 [Omnitrophica WOR_2 bacterium GWA2_47_8]|nr:MAG: hypothetical protein A2Z88_07740 [Omnitrophica WOR_2 bacterium GWA2_47_8]